jgi:hypothetical protein
MGGICGIQCTSPAILCSGVCVNPLADADNCGMCGKRCPSPANSTGYCNAGSCATICDTGYSLCNNTCVNTNTDKQNCGSCGYACMGNRSCVSGACTK